MRDTQSNAKDGSQPLPTVAIIGAGITGLITAHGLKKHGFPIKIYESEPYLNSRPRDWTILFHWGLPILTRLLPATLLARLNEAVTTPHLTFTPDNETFIGYRGSTGEILFNSPTPGGRRVSRNKMRALLLEGLQDDVHWGKAVRDIAPQDESQGFTLHFTDNNTASSSRADFVLGADGATSAVRKWLFSGASDDDTRKAGLAVPSGCFFASGLVDYADATKVQTVLAAHPVASIMMGSGIVVALGVLRAENPTNIASWTLFWAVLFRLQQQEEGAPPPAEGEEAIAYVKRLVRAKREQVCEPFRSAVEWTPEGSTCTISNMRTWRPVRWDNRGGRVTLVGDAAHPMLPFRGQGMQNGVVDADNYLTAMLAIGKAWKDDAATVERVMTAFEAEMVPRGDLAVQQSLSEFEKAMDPVGVDKMLMVTRGHGRLE